MVSACLWGNEAERRVNEDCVGQLSRVEFCKRKYIEKGASFGGKAGRDDDLHFGYVELNVFVWYPNADVE